MLTARLGRHDAREAEPGLGEQGRVLGLGPLLPARVTSMTMSRIFPGCGVSPAAAPFDDQQAPARLHRRRTLREDREALSPRSSRG